jgi:hypothetical protein
LYFLIFLIWILGLFIGVSVLSMVEALEFMLRIIFLLLKRCKRRQIIKPEPATVVNEKITIEDIESE